jgi:hypothetical protein
VRWTVAGILLLCLLASCGKRDGRVHSEVSRPLLIAPMIAGADFCPQAVADPAVADDEEAAFFCASRDRTGGSRISRALRGIGPKMSPSGKYELGYALPVPLFRYFVRQDGKWKLDTRTLKSNLKVISEVDRPVVIYLSSNHFTDAGGELSAELAKDSRNLMWTPRGPLAPDDYFNYPVIAWTLSDQSAPITLMRKQAFSAALDAICALPEASRNRIAGVSVLGETHDLFRNFMQHPSFDVPANEVTDYSPVAVRGFRGWLAHRYGGLHALNRALGGDFASIDSVDPPSVDILKRPMGGLLEHLDAYAAGQIPVYGWISDSKNRALTVTVLLDGKVEGTAATALNRTDVLKARPALRNPNVGFRFDLDFRRIPAGAHTLEVLISADGAKPMLLSKRSLVVDGRQPSSRSAAASSSLQRSADANGAVPMSADANLTGNLDGPVSGASALYNPLAKDWLDYRNEVVRKYIEQFAAMADKTCIPKDKIFSYQITPELMGNWNGDLLAADASKAPSRFYTPGTSLYGGAAFSPEFLRMKKQLGWDRYAVNELHPIVKLTARQYHAMFEMHRIAGAAFVSPYYLSLRPGRREPATGLTRYRLSRDNPRFASDKYLQSLKDIMKQ